MAINFLHRRELFIIATIDLMDKSGIQGLSTREIAKREGVSEATIFRHFKNKKELLSSVLDFFPNTIAILSNLSSPKKNYPLKQLPY